MNEAEFLPPVAQEIVEVIGLDGLKRLVKQFGGTTIRVPGRGNNLRQVLTSEQYADFVHTFRNESLFIPKLQAVMHQIELAETGRLLEEGMTKSEAARALQLTDRTIYHRQAKLKQQQDDQQQELF